MGCSDDVLAGMLSRSVGSRAWGVMRPSSMSVGQNLLAFEDAQLVNIKSFRCSARACSHGGCS